MLLCILSQDLYPRVEIVRSFSLKISFIYRKLNTFTAKTIKKNSMSNFNTIS